MCVKPSHFLSLIYFRLIDFISGLMRRHYEKSVATQVTNR